MESFRRISPKDTKLSPKDSRISSKDTKLSPKDSWISSKDKKISSIKKTWKMCWGGEVKGEGYILNLILYSFFRVFPIFDPRVLFWFYPFSFTHAYIYKIEFSNLHPSPFYLTLWVSNSYGWRVVKGVFRFL